MDYKPSDIKEVIEINLPTFKDSRGFFREVFRISEINKLLNFEFEIKQMNHSQSVKNTLRGIHVAPWNKLIYVTKGTVKAVITDLRPSSETFGKYLTFEVGENTKNAIFIPKGFGNSYLVLTDMADYIYLTDKEWEPNKEIGIIWNDPQINIDWQLNEKQPLLSDKDEENLTLKKIQDNNLLNF